LASNHNRSRTKGCKQNILIYCTNGEGWYSIGGNKQILLPNQFCILPSNTPHSYGSNTAHPWTIYWVHFMGYQSENIIKFLFNNNGYLPLNISSNYDRFNLFKDIFSHIEMSYNYDNIVYANACFSHFLFTLKQSIFNPNIIEQSEKDPIGIVITYMKEHLSESLTLEDFSSCLEMSKSHFSALFKQKVQSSPMNFFILLKMQHACHLLEYSKHRIKEIAYFVGYSDPYHFSRVFKSYMTTSPKDYRKKLR
jgi:AraC family transcriptional regulator, arabinose operon regulatory protein